NIEYQLRRAVVTGHTVLNKGTQVNQVLSLVVEAMEKIYSERRVELIVNANDQLRFFGDENDLMEIFGNLLDNAFKYAEKKILVEVESLPNGLNIRVEDDGPGFSEDEATRIFTRGERLDQQGLGQGIGLAVVYDVVTSYGGRINASESSLGGAMFHIVFPNKDPES
ncbi:MAG: ATP-binding protein, partial [Pseudomonadales bacterium]|nr:ATP-binding protein [Pseudomonadales bacterium]